jgi:hypothetical protein
MAAKRKLNGGEQRAKYLDRAARLAIARAGGEARWKHRRVSSNGEVPRATHIGELRLGDALIPCAVLEDGTRVISQRGIGGALGRKPGGRDWNPATTEGSAGKLPYFMASANLKPFISAELEVLGNRPIRYSQQGGEAFGIPAKALPMICNAWLRAREAHALRADQLHIAAKAEILVRGLAEVAIEALVDEATGFQTDRAPDALAKILEAFIAKELRPWVHTFPDDFYKEMFRLRDWPYDHTSTERYPLVGMLTNNVVYQRLAPGVLVELQKHTARNAKGRLVTHLHRRLSTDIGHPKLREHLNILIALMRGHTDWKAFVRHLDRSLPRLGHTYEMQLQEPESASS